MIRCTLIPRMRFRGWDGSLPIQTTEAKVLPLTEALAGWYPSDACILCYSPPDAAASMPRLNKSALAFFELEGEPYPRLEVILVDVDYPNHATPPEGWADGIVDLSPWPCGWYRTPSGLRLIYQPAEPVPINLADSYIEQLHAQLDAAGIPTDKTTRDWTRLFKAPHALGRDFDFDYADIQPIAWHPETLVEADAHSVGAIISRDFGTARDTVPTKPPAWADLAPLGRNSRLAKALKDQTLAAPVGKRHATLLGAVRSVVDAFETEDPMVPFHLIQPCASAMGKTDPELWRICEWACAHRAGQAEERNEAREEAERAIIEDLGISEADVYSRIVVDTGREFYVWDEERGDYSTGYSAHTQLLGALARHCPNLADGYYGGKIPTNVIFRDLSTVANKVILTYLDAPVGYDKATYAFYQRVCRRDRSLRPKFNPDVHTWLGLLAGGGENAAHVYAWCAAYPELSKPVCALYIRGPASIGKGMLAAGLARLYSPECTITPYAQLLKEFNPTLKESPLIYADEKVPQDAFSDNDSSVFRRIVGNGSILIRDLHRSPATLVGYPRVLITANNEDALDIREDLSADDLAAVQLRVGFVDSPSVGDDVHPAAKFLEEYAERVGAESARDATQAWVDGGAIARHVLWLAENYEYTQGDRFLVEGWESPLTRALATAAGSTGAVAEFVAQIIDGREQSTPLEAIRWFGGKVYVNNEGLGAEWAAKVRQGADKPPRSTSRLKALRALSGGENARLDVPTSHTRKQLSYWAIDADVVARLAEDRGICPASEIIDACARTEPVPNSQRVTISAMGANK